MKVPIEVNVSLKKVPTKNNYNLWLTSFGSFLLSLQIGISYSWDSPNLARLTQPDSPVPLSEEQASWLASATFIGIFAGALVGAAVNRYVGCRKTILATFCVMSAPWFLLMLTASVEMLYFARLLCGIAVGSATFCFPLYLGEVSPPGVRGSLFAIGLAGIPAGTVVGTVAETYLTMRVSSSIYLSQCALSIALFSWLMDSPYYLVKRDFIELARKAVIFYNSWDCDADKELLDIRSFVKAEALVAAEGEGGGGLRERLREFALPHVRRSTALIVTLFALPSLTGSSTVVSYTEIIVRNSGVKWIKPEQYVIYANLAGAVLSVATHNLIDRLGRRRLLLAAVLTSLLAMTGLGAHYFLLVYGSWEPQGLQWLPLAAVFLSLASQFVGLLPVASTVLGEIFSDSVKSTAACVSVLAESLFTFAMVKLYQTMVNSMGEAATFGFYAVMSAAAIPFALCMMMETKGKSLQEIQNHLSASTTEKPRF